MRKAAVKRKTKETDITLALNLDGSGKYRVASGIGFLDHMLTLFSRHGLIDLHLKAKGDLHIDIHHTNEDVGIALGQALGDALKNKKGLTRFATCYAVLDEALVRVVLDVSGRSFLDISVADKKINAILMRKDVQGYTFNYFKQFVRALVNAAGLSVHIDVIKGEDAHHVLECCFKALGLALDKATIVDKRKKGLPTTKGKL